MTPKHDPEHWRDEQMTEPKWWIRLGIVERMAVWLGLAGFFLGIGGYIWLHWGRISPKQVFEAFYQDVSITLIGVVITVLTIDRLNRQEAIRQRRQELILQMGSPNNSFAVEAARLLRLCEWGFHDDTSLHSARFEYADLRRANLRDANLFNAGFQHAFLDDASLYEANLQRAKFFGCSLERTILTGANLQGANLKEASLAEATLSRAIFNEQTTLPDGSKWTPSTDLTKFTDKTHSDFWKPERT